MLKYREDLEKVVTKEEIEKRNEIVDKTNERGWFFKKEAKFLLSFEGKARVCNTCGRTLTETKGWRLVSAPDRYGNNLQIGYAANCFECEMRDIMSFDLYKKNTLYKWCYSRHQIKSSLTWNTVYLEKAVEYKREYGDIDKNLLKHISPLNWSHINFLGEYSFQSNMALGLNEYRPLKV